METYLLTFSAACLAALLDGTANLINHCQTEAAASLANVAENFWPSMENATQGDTIAN